MDLSDKIAKHTSHSNISINCLTATKSGDTVYKRDTRVSINRASTVVPRLIGTNQEWICISLIFFLFQQLLSVLLASEEEIKTRSKAIESHWSPDKYQDKSSGETHFTDCSTKIKISMVNQFGIKSYPANIFAIKIF